MHSKNDLYYQATSMSSGCDKVIKPLRELPSYLDPVLAKTIGTVTNSKLSLFRLPNTLFGRILDYLGETSAVNAVTQACRETHRLFQNQMRDEYQKKQPLLQQLLQYVVDANFDSAEEFIKWHYRFQLVTVEEKIPNPPEKDVIYVEKTGNDLNYSLTTSDGKCSIKEGTLTLADLNEVQKSLNGDEKDKKGNQKIEIPANFNKDNLKALRRLILAITHKNKYTQPKNNRCLLMMKGMVGCDLHIMSDEKNMQTSGANCLRLYRENNSLVYRVNGTKYRFENVQPELNVELLKLFDEKGLNKNGILANNKLKWPQIEACKTLLAVTAKEGHSSYVHSSHRIRGTPLQIALGAEDVSRKMYPDEGMVEMLMGELKKLPEGEAHIKKQIQEQFPIFLDFISVLILGWNVMMGGVPHGTHASGLYPINGSLVL